MLRQSPSGGELGLHGGPEAAFHAVGGFSEEPFTGDIRGCRLLLPG